jgi:hypothetical protein
MCVLEEEVLGGPFLVDSGFTESDRERGGRDISA